MEEGGEGGRGRGRKREEGGERGRRRGREDEKGEEEGGERGRRRRGRENEKGEEEGRKRGGSRRVTGQGSEAHRKEDWTCEACLLLVPTASARSEGNSV